MGVRVRKYCLLGLILFVVALVCCILNLHEENPEKKTVNNRPVIRDAGIRRALEELPAGNANLSSSNEYRREFIKQMMKFAWDNYRQYAWGTNELRPISKIGHSSSVFGRAELGATVIDAIDTLYIMNMTDEFDDAREWVRTSFDMKAASGDLSIFETNIRFVGGLLSAYSLTSDQLFLTKARETANLLLPAFQTPTGIPLALVNMRTGRSQNYGWASGGCSILSEYGSLELEFDFLSRVTGNSTYTNVTKRIRETLASLEKPDGGLYPNYLNPRTGKFCLKHVSVGALGDSFYEYLLKQWLIMGKKDSQLKETYDAAIAAIERGEPLRQLLRQSQQNGLWYFAEMRGSRIEHKMDHLSCFIGGLFALQSANEEGEEKRKHFLELAERIAHTCHESYVKTATGIGPETFRFTDKLEAMAVRDNEMYYILRPEAIESWLILWRVTGNPKYREWCWSAALAIEKYCRVAAGYSGIRNVYNAAPTMSRDDVQQSFFLAETLKYLFLTFTDPSYGPHFIPLDEWVFNTEAHPLPMSSTQRFNSLILTQA